MKLLRHKILFSLLIIFILSAENIFAQNDTTSVAKDTLQLENQIPTLDEFITSALENSPLVHISDKQVDEIFQQIKKEKMSWVDFFFVEANARYGLYNQLQISGASTDGTDIANAIGTTSNKQQLNYYFGVSLKLPISKLVNPKSELKILNENLEEKKHQRDEIIDQLKRLITEEYFNLNYLHKSMKINEDMLQALNINLMRARKDLESGIISIDDYNNKIVEKGKVEDSFYKIQNNFYAQYKKLEILTGFNKNTEK